MVDFNYLKMIEFSTLTDAAEYLDISQTRLSNYLKKNEAPSDAKIKGYIISKISKDLQNSTVSKSAQAIEVTNVETNEITVFPSFVLAAKALGIRRSSISGYLMNKRTSSFWRKK